MQLKMSSGKYGPFCLSLNVLSVCSLENEEFLAGHRGYFTAETGKQHGRQVEPKARLRVKNPALRLQNQMTTKSHRSAWQIYCKGI